ncbi:DUF2304 domain-containing protein [Paenibacillus alginolyticus]|uniref:DUF2304 domain-containing protein n=1 Tax=Paenibacillus alginolyticus TaxID=59839 RepID=UPI000492BD2C|nr:DUF2304 domain-containing protein [Paenibacillus alginolyticus]MCY9664833.1 DUF2304 domain-containing protein [Paenibacillus alginolyticus]
MIPYHLQIILFIFSISTFLMIINMIRKYKLELQYALLWLFLSFVNILLALYPSISIKLAGLLSIELPVNALFLCSIFVMLLILFNLTLALSKFSNNTKFLSQHLGVLKQEVEQLKKTIKEIEDNKVGKL